MKEIHCHCILFTQLCIDCLLFRIEFAPYVHGWQSKAASQKTNKKLSAMI